MSLQLNIQGHVTWTNTQIQEECWFVCTEGIHWLVAI